MPKRDAERRRQNKPSTPTETIKVEGKVKIPNVKPDWHPLAKDWYRSLKESGQSQFYEPSDWAVAQIVAEVLTRNLKQGGRMSAQMFATVMATMATLLSTEGDRRRVRMEIERNAGAPVADVSVLDDYRDSFG